MSEVPLYGGPWGWWGGLFRMSKAPLKNAHGLLVGPAQTSLMSSLARLQGYLAYRAVSIRRSHNTRSHTRCADVDVKYLTSAH